ncbi:hypothetical protein ACQP10_38090 (plasmid) [Streptosporangium sandarakinum]|uniref:hypothetical protein n=1 Tax=Streptosporangium sandarakinum TaxID=1260955 RepID=UPI003D94C87B
MDPELGAAITNASYLDHLLVEARRAEALGTSNSARMGAPDFQLQPPGTWEFCASDPGAPGEEVEAIRLGER